MSGDQRTHHSVGDAADLGIDGLIDVAVVGSGGSSTVYQARQDVLDRSVAVKVVHAAWSIETRERFEHEREVMGRMSGHAAIVPIFETGITKRGEPYLLMPFYPRGSLFRLMKDRGPLPWLEAVYMLETLSTALADTHNDGIVHRDVKPGNVLLTRHLQPRLSDFGIALPSGISISGGSVAYTPSYSPPEAFKGGSADPNVDVYSLGATLWAMLAGRAPFTHPGESVDAATVMERSLHEDLGPPAPSTPEPILELLRHSMSKDPAKRPADAGEFAAELHRAIRLSEQKRPTKEQPRRNRRDLIVSSVLIGMVTAGLVLLTVGAGWLLFS